MHPLVRYARVEFTYIFQMTQAAPYLGMSNTHRFRVYRQEPNARVPLRFFFGLYESAGGRKGHRDAYTVSRLQDASHLSFPPIPGGLEAMINGREEVKHFFHPQEKANPHVDI